MTSFARIDSGIGRGMARRIASWMAAGCVLAVLSAGAAPASDFSHLARDRRRRLRDGERRAVRGQRLPRGFGRGAAPHRAVRDGRGGGDGLLCISWAKAAADRMFDFQYRRSRSAHRFHVRRRPAGRRNPMHARADGLPANLDCDRRVVANRQGVVAEMPAATSYWFAQDD